MDFESAHATNACAFDTGYPGTPEALTVTNSSWPESLYVFAPETAMTCLPETSPSTFCVGPGTCTTYALGIINTNTHSTATNGPAR